MDRSTESANSQDDIGYNFDLGDEYELNHFLTELAKEITTEELKILKFYIGGRGGSGKAALEGIKDALDYFNHLRQKDLLSMENICILEAFIWHLGRKDLYKKMVEFGRQFEKQTLYFYTPRETPENGYKYVKFHVKGKVVRADVERIHLQIAKVLRVPIEFVSIAGVEKANSIIITLMVPEECGFTLSSLTNKEKSILDQLSIDHFTMDGIGYNVTDAEYVDNTDEETVAVLKLMEKGNRMKKELDSCHADIVTYKRKIAELSNFNEQKVIETTNAYMYMQMLTLAFKAELLHKISDDNTPHPLQQQASLKHLNGLLEKAKRSNYDLKLLNEMLEINGIIVKTSVKVAYDMLIQQQQWEIDMANASLMHSQYLNQRLSFLLGKNLEETEGNLNSVEFLQYVALQKALPIINNISVEVQGTPIDDDTLKRILYEISKELKKEEKTAISKNIKMDKKEADLYRKDPNKLLEIIMLKTRKPNVPFSVDQFILHYLEKVNRQDLIEISNRIVKEMQARNEPSARRKDQQTAGNKQTQGKKQRESSPEQSSEINSRLQKMEEMIEKLVQVSTSKYQSKLPHWDDIENNKLAAQLYFSQRYVKGLE